ncbi:MAG: macro domain-containing protein [Anaerolineales bacterium]|nr:macro domain-containing protein [Anaerolineales bacterium]
MSNLIAEHTLHLGQTVRLFHGDLTEEKVDAIVNAANAHLAHGGGVAGAIVRKGGKQIQVESDAWVRDHGRISHERPAITSAGSLPCDYVIHVVGPKWGEGNEDQKLHAAVTGGLTLAGERGMKSLALPAISTGIFGFPKERAAKIILDAISDFLSAQPQASLQDIRLTLIDEPSVQIFAQEFERRWPGSIDPP